jgi:hypothetical protein
MRSDESFLAIKAFYLKAVTKTWKESSMFSASVRKDVQTLTSVARVLLSFFSDPISSSGFLTNISSA